MTKNQALDNLITHFGKANALRIYSCGMLLAQSCQNAHGDTVIGIRMAIGALKKIRQKGGYQLISWGKAIEILENEQDEGRHYRIVQTDTMAEIDRIEQANGTSYTKIIDGIAQEVDTAIPAQQATKMAKAAAIAMIRNALLDAQKDYVADVQAQADTQAWVQQYWMNISRTKRTYLHNVIDVYSARRAVSEDIRKNISKHYAPVGIKPMEFIEVLARYVKVAI